MGCNKHAAYLPETKDIVNSLGMLVGATNIALNSPTNVRTRSHNDLGWLVGNKGGNANGMPIKLHVNASFRHPINNASRPRISIHGQL